MVVLPKVIFFSRSYQAKLLPLLKSDLYESVHITLTLSEKNYIESLGMTVEFCFETFEQYSESLPENYLITSLGSDRFLNKYKLKERTKILKKEIAFWECIFDKYQPIAVVNEQVAIEIAEVMYIEARKRQIRYLAWMSSPVNGYFHWIADPLDLSLAESVVNQEPKINSLNLAKEYISNIINKHERPYYLTPYLGVKRYENLISSVKGIIKLLFRGTKRKKNQYEDYWAADLNAFERSVKSYLIGYDSVADLEEFEIVLYPLHYEPESSLLYLSEFFSDQVALIENISKCLNENQVLVVKEHPAQYGMLLTKKYQDLHKKVSNLYFLPHTITSYEIIQKSSLIITCTSHLGWEALILGKPVFLLGKMFYDKYPLINKFSSFEALREDIRANNFIIPKMDETERFIAQIIEISFKGYPFPSNELYTEVNIHNLIFAIEFELGLRV